MNEAYYGQEIIEIFKNLNLSEMPFRYLILCDLSPVTQLKVKASLALSEIQRTSL